LEAKRSLPRDLEPAPKEKLAAVLKKGRIVLKFVHACGAVHSVDTAESIDSVETTASSEPSESTILHASVDPIEPIAFKKVKHGHQPLAHVENTTATKATLSDIAEVLEVYDTGFVIIEGHTATPDEKMDDWAKELAQNRADKIKDELTACGVTAERLVSRGVPGKSGDGHPDVVIKITGF